MNIRGIKINYQESYINIDSSFLIISWILDTKQTDYQIIIKEKEKKIYDSNKVNSSENIIYVKNLDLKAETQYTVLIETWNHSEFNIQSQEFRTSIFGKFIGKWISNGENIKNETDYYNNNRNCLIRKKFSISNVIHDAFLYIVGLGYYNVYINGNKIGKAELNTDWTKYSKKIYYDVFEVGKYLKAGENIISVELGNGWYNPSPLRLFGKYNLREVLEIGEPKLLADLKINTDSKNQIIIATDGSWEVAEGPYLFNNIYLGEKIDFRLWDHSWKSLESVNTEWKKAVLTSSPGGELSASFIEKVEATKLVEAKDIFVNEKQKVLIDFGETIEGFIDITFNGVPGQEVTLTYGENLNTDGTVNVDTTAAGSVRKLFNVHQIDGGPGAPKTAAQKDICILINGKIRYINKFTYHSFRYVEVGGIGIENISEIKAVYVHTNLKEAGEFRCSNEFLNQLYKIAKRTQQNNIHSVFEDCARERLGYGGDVVCLAASQIFMFEPVRMYQKIIKDFRYDIRENGGLPETAPYVGIKSNGTGESAGPLGWQLVYSYLMEKLYQYYGDKRTIEREYKCIKRQVGYLIGLGIEKLSNCCLGDWGSAEAKDDKYKKVSPDVEFTASCFYYYHIELLAKFAKIIGNEEDYNQYAARAFEVKKDIINNYMNEDGTYSGKSQTSYAFALFFGLDNEPQRLADKFADLIIKNDYYITCGIFGMFMTYEVLRKYNHQDVIYRWLNSKNESSFYNMLKNGQSTLSEHVHVRGDEGSDNHAMYSSYVQWFYEGLAGIIISKDAFGADKLLIKPYFEEDINYVQCSYESIKGTIVSNWVRDKENIILHIQIPENLNVCSLVIDKKYRHCLQDYAVDKYDENYISINLLSNNNVISLKLNAANKC